VVTVKCWRERRERSLGNTLRQVHRDLPLETEMLLSVAAPQPLHLDPQRTRDLLDQQFELFGGSSAC